MNKKKEKKGKKVKKEFEWEKYGIRQIALKISYFGGAYGGFVTQPPNVSSPSKKKDSTGGPLPSVEDMIWSALQRSFIVKDVANCNWSRCGRTDKGVSGFGQVISFQARSTCTQGLGIIKPSTVSSTPEKEIDYLSSINTLLPDDIRVLAWSPVSSDFDARFNCISRTYKYFFLKGNYDIERMREGCKHLVGKNNFRNFCKFDASVLNHEREIYNAEIDEFPDQIVCCFTVKASGFLWHQVRNMMAILYMIGDHSEQPDIISKLLDVKSVPNKPQYRLASEEGLTLIEGEYPPNTFEWSSNPEQGSLEYLEKHFCSIYSKLTLQSAMVQCLMTSVHPSFNFKTSYPKFSQPIFGNTPPTLKRRRTSNHIPLLNRDTELPYDLKRQKQLEKMVLFNHQDREVTNENS